MRVHIYLRELIHPAVHSLIPIGPEYRMESDASQSKSEDDDDEEEGEEEEEGGGKSEEEEE